MYNGCMISELLSDTLYYLLQGTTWHHPLLGSVRKMFLIWSRGSLVMDSCISQSAYSGRATHRPRSSQPNRLTATRTPGIIPCWTSVGVVLTVVGVYPSCSAAQSVFPLLIVYRQPLCHTAGRDCLQVAFSVWVMEPPRKEAKDNPSASANLLSKIFFW